MPQLPDVQSLGARPTPRAQRGVAVYNGGRTEQAIGNLGVTVGQIGEMMQREDDTAAVFAARRQLDDWERQAIYDPEKGARTKLGKDAFGVPQELAQSYDEFAAKLAEGMTSTRQRQAFAEMSTGRRAQVLNWAAGHAAQQREVYHKAEVNADLAAIQERAARIAATPSDGTPEGAARQAAQVQAEIQLGQSRLIGYMRERGMPGIEGATLEFSSKSHQAVIKQLIAAGDTAGAREYLKAHKGAMQTKDATELQDSLREAVALGKAQTAADEVLASGLRGQAALDAVRQKFVNDPVGRKHAEDQVKTRLTEENAFNNQRAGELTGQAWDAVMNRGGMKAVPPAVWDELRRIAPEKARDEERQMRDWLDAKYRQSKSDAENKVTPENTKEFLRLIDMATEEPYKFGALKLEQKEPFLTKQQFNTLVGLRIGINKNDAKTSSVLAAQKKALVMVLPQMHVIGIDTTPKEGTKAAKDFDEYKSQLYSALSSATESASGPLTEPQIKEIALGLLKTGLEQGSGWFGSNVGRKEVPAYKMEQGKTYVSKAYNDIPADAQRKLALEFVEKGQAIETKGGEIRLSDAQKRAVEVAYQRGLEAGRFK